VVLKFFFIIFYYSSKQSTKLVMSSINIDKIRKEMGLIFLTHPAWDLAT